MRVDEESGVSIVRRLAGIAPVVAAAAVLACHDQPAPTSTKTVAPPPPPPLGAITRLTLPTPDGSTNILHPSVHCSSVACFMLACEHTTRDGHNGARSDILENTLGYQSAGTDMLSWTPVANPIMSADEVDSTTNLSDPELLDLGSTLVAYQRLVPVGFDVLYMKETSDTVAWTPPREVLRTPANAAISPTVLQNADAYDLWVVDARPQGCMNPSTVTVRRRSRTYADFSAAAVDTTDLTVLRVGGMVPWHIEMIRGPADTPDSLILLVAMHPVGEECGKSSLYIGTSSDGLHFRINPGPVRTGAEPDAIFSMVYRSSGVYFAKNRTFTVLLSGLKTNADPGARLARIEYDYDSLLAATREGRHPAPRRVIAEQFTNVSPRRSGQPQPPRVTPP